MWAMGVTLRRITDDNIGSVLTVRTTAEQERFVSPVGQSLAEAAEWLGDYRRFWTETLDRLDAYVNDLKQQEKRRGKPNR